MYEQSLSGRFSNEQPSSLGLYKSVTIIIGIYIKHF